jgi:hypothetical protein
LPAPPQAACRAAIAELAERASQVGLTASLRSELDDAVFTAFDITASEGSEIGAFVRELSPSAGLATPLA